jgi:hypothetical protein
MSMKLLVAAKTAGSFLRSHSTFAAGQVGTISGCPVIS